MKPGADRFDSGSMKDRIVRSIWALGELATRARLRKAVDCTNDVIFDMQIEGMHKRGEIYIAAAGHYALRGDLADTMLELYPPKKSAPAVESSPPPDPPQESLDLTPPTQEPTMKGKKCAKCKATKPKDAFDKWQRECRACQSDDGTQTPAPTSTKEKPAAKPAKKKAAAPKKRAAAAAIAEAPVVDELVIQAAGAIKCKAQGTNGGRQFLLEQDGALIVCDPAQLLELVGWGTLQLRVEA